MRIKAARLIKGISEGAMLQKQTRRDTMLRDIIIGSIVGYVIGRLHENPQNVEKIREFVTEKVDEILAFVEEHREKS